MGRRGVELPEEGSSSVTARLCFRSSFRVGGSSLFIRRPHSLSSGITPGRVVMKQTTHAHIAKSRTLA